MSTRQALGRGLESLIPAEADLQTSTGGARHELPIDAISPNPFQPRKDFPPQELDELAASVREQGVIQPLIVRTRTDGTYELVAGERRLRAAKLAGLAQVPVLIRETSDAESLEIALVENLQREDLNPVDEARAYQQLITQFQLSQEEMAKKVGKDRTSVANTLRLLKLPEAVLALVASGRLSEGHARAILSLESEEAMLRLAQKIQRDGLSVREAERLAQGGRRTAKPRAAKNEIKDPHARQLEEDLRRKLGTHVRVVQKTSQKGKLEIEYYSLEDLDRIVSLLG